MSLADERLNEAVKGDREALEALLREHGPPLRQHLAGEIPKRWSSLLTLDDVIQETWIDAYTDIRGFKPYGQGAFAAWLKTLAHRNLRDALRALKAEKRGGNRLQIRAPIHDNSLVSLYELLEATSNSPSRQAAGREALNDLNLAIEALPDPYRQVVVMYDVECRPMEEVAATLKISPGAVHMKRSRAHKRLKSLMGRASKYFSDAS